MREAVFSKDYEMIWGNRLGFAKVANLAKCVCLNDINI